MLLAAARINILNSYFEEEIFCVELCRSSIETLRPHRLKHYISDSVGQFSANNEKHLSDHLLLPDVQISRPTKSGVYPVASIGSNRIEQSVEVEEIKVTIYF